MNLSIKFIEIMKNKWLILILVNYSNIVVYRINYIAVIDTAISKSYYEKNRNLFLAIIDCTDDHYFYSKSISNHASIILD